MAKLATLLQKGSLDGGSAFTPPRGARTDAVAKDGKRAACPRAAARSMAARLAEGLAGVNGAHLLRQPDGNQMFLTMDPGLAGRLRAAGAEFDDWPEVGPNVVRLVTAFNTREEDVETFLSLAKAS